jgi:hypothetical protein
MESIELSRRLKNQCSAKRCYFCDGDGFEKLTNVTLFKSGIAIQTDATMCKTCGHVDIFIRSKDGSNENGSNTTLPEGKNNP